MISRYRMVAPLVLLAWICVANAADRPTTQGPSGRILYVCPKGNDAWSGRLPAPNEGRTDGPFASITKARDAIRQMKAKQGGLNEAVTVQIRGGAYRLTEAIALAPEDSGTKQ